MADAITIKALQDASLDAKSLEEVVNGDETKQVTTRKGETYPSVKKAIKQMFAEGGLPATPFKTMALLNASSLNEGSFAVVTDDNNNLNNGLYIKESGGWVKSKFSPEFIAEGVASKAYDAALASILDASHNLFDLSASISAIITSDGSITLNFQDYLLSDYIPVVPDEYRLYGGDDSTGFLFGFSDIAYFDKDKGFLYRKSLSTMPASEKTVITTEPQELVVKIPREAYFIRVNFKNRVNMQLYKGREEKPFLPFGKVLRQDIEASGDMTAKLTSEAVGAVDDRYLDNPSSTIKMDLMPSNTRLISGAVRPPNNLYNYNTATQGYVILATGEVVENTQHFISDYIPVKASTEYSLSHSRDSFYPFNIVAFYDNNKSFISRSNVPPHNNGHSIITTHPSASFIRAASNVGKVGESDKMINEGVEVLPYDDGAYPYLDGARLSGVAASSLVDAVDNALKKPFSVDMPFNGVFNNNKPKSFFTHLTNWPYKPATEVIGLYEQLRIQNPEYIKKRVLGQDAVGNDILLYTLKPELDAGSRHKPQVKRPKVFLTLAIHGYEHLGCLSTYLLIEQMCNNWQSDPLLQALRFNVEFLIIPIVNMSGFDSQVRGNSNGVDLNRNFPEGFVVLPPDEVSYGGTEPLSELETQYISQVFDENPDIDIMYDYHTMTGTNFTYLWIPTQAGELMERVGHNLMTRMSHKYARDLDFLPTTNVKMVGYVDRVPGAMVQSHAIGRGVKLAATFETSRYWGAESGLKQYDETHCITAYESLTNLMLLSVDTLVSK